MSYFTELREPRFIDSDKGRILSEICLVVNSTYRNPFSESTGIAYKASIFRTYARNGSIKHSPIHNVPEREIGVVGISWLSFRPCMCLRRCKQKLVSKKFASRQEEKTGQMGGEREENGVKD